MQAGIAKRPAAEPGTYMYWRWELREFFMLLEKERDFAAGHRAFSALGLVAMQTEPKGEIEETFFAAELVAATSRFERWQTEAIRR